MKGAYVPLSVAYRESERVLGVQPLAELMFVRGLAFAKEKGSGGFIGARQVRLLAADLSMYGADDGDLVAELVAVGLWVEVDGGWLIEGWLDWNEADASRAGAWGNHKRWHLDRGLVANGCPHCSIAPESHPTTPDIAPDSGEHRPRIAKEGKRKQDNNTRAVDSEFAAWWTNYPRKVDKTDAEKAYVAARKSASAEQLASGLECSVNQWRRENRPTDKMPHGATWLNHKRWTDEFTDAEPEVDVIHGQRLMRT